jgi:hypothetical protein
MRAFFSIPELCFPERLEMIDLSEYKHLWDGSEKGWILQRFDRDLMEIEILFDETGPSIKEIKALRSVIPEYGRRKIKAVFDELRGQRQIRIGEFESIEGRRIAEACDKEKVRTRIKGRVETTFLPFNKETQLALVIEDDTVALAVAEEGIRQGMKVEHITT